MSSHGTPDRAFAPIPTAPARMPGRQARVSHLTSLTPGSAVIDAATDR